jgi:hypothetical protein
MMKKILLVLSFMVLTQFIFAKQSFQVSMQSKTPTIDGIISVNEWQDAIWLTEFYQTSPGDNATPSEKTEIAISCDEKNLYLMAKVHFNNSGRSRNFHGSRDKIYTSDRIFFFFDTFGSNNQAYYVGCNAYGEQADGLIRQEIDPSIDLFYISRTADTNYGHSIEMKVPLKSLNYKSGKNVEWGFFIKRHICDGGEQITSFPVDRNGGNFYDNYAILKFASLPEKRNLKLIPSVTGIQSKTEDKISHTTQEDDDVQPELNLFFEPNSNLTFTATVNPDFNIIEADGLNIEINSRFPSWSQEKRPFFIEERNPFQTDMNIFHTRNIVNPLWAAKISGNYGKNSFFLLTAQDEDAVGERFDYSWQDEEDDAYFAFGNYKRQFGENESFIRIASALRSFQKYNNIVLNADSFIRYSNFMTQELQFTTSSNELENDNNSGYAFHSDIDINTEYIYLEHEQTGVSPGFKADLGFMYETDYHRTETTLEYHRSADNEDEFIHYLEFASTLNLKWDFACNDLQEVYWSPMLGMNTRANWNLWTGYEKIMLHWYEQDNWDWYQWISAEYFPTKEIGFTHLHVFGEGLYLWSDHANPQPYRKYESTLYLRPFSQLDIELKHKYHYLKEYYLARTAEAIVKVQFHKNFWFRLIVQVRNDDSYYQNKYTDSVDIYPLFTYKPNSKMSIYLGATGSEYEEMERNQTGNSNHDIYNESMERTTWFLKCSYTFDIL